MVNGQWPIVNCRRLMWRGGRLMRMVNGQWLIVNVRRSAGCADHQQLAICNSSINNSPFLVSH